MRITRLLASTTALAAATTVASAAPAFACVTVGVYQDNPARSLTALTRQTGPGLGAISVYLTAGNPLPANMITTANRHHARLVVTWEPDAGKDGANQPKYQLTAITKGRYDASLKALVAQLSRVKKGVVLRPMPEMNTPWYAWSGAVNGNSAARYIAAWRHVRAVVKHARHGRRIQMLWAPYAQSIPDTGTNQIGDYFPGASQVDLVGASGYNFGTTGSLSWTDPATLFSPAYDTIEAMVAKPFWIAETASTATGGDKAQWIQSLANLPATSMPKLAGVLWYDIADSNGDFTLRGSSVTSAFKTLLKEACR